MKIIKITVLSVLCSLAFSCASKKELEKYKEDYQVCIERNAEKDRVIAQLQERNKALQVQAKSATDMKASLERTLSDCMSMSKTGSINIEKLISQINASQDYIKQLTEARAKNDSLNLAISNKLKRSLDNLNDDDVNIQVQKGVVFISLSDNMLYKSGSYEVLPSAETVIAKVATIINDYKDYDVQIQGYTDTDQFRSGAGCIRDNWDLSVMRSTSIVRLLQTKFGVNPARMLAGGHGEYQPKTSNNTAQGKAANRRTEIVILPKLDQFMKLVEEGGPKQ